MSKKYQIDPVLVFGSEPAESAPPAAGGFITATDAQGNIHHAPAGTPLPRGWKLVK